MFPRRLPLFALAILVGGACQAKSSASSAQDQPARRIELHEPGGKVTAKVIPGHPCRVTIDDHEMLIGTEPLVVQIGEVRWTGELAANGTTFKRDGVPAARMFPDDSPNEVGLYGADGLAMFRSTVAGDKADIVNGAGAAIVTVTKSKGALAIGDRQVTGTDDLLLAALLAAPEASPEVRGLAACHRLFPPAKAVP